eukprot:364204-Chlamydomonas_euryale.AAC.5
MVTIMLLPAGSGSPACKRQVSRDGGDNVAASRHGCSSLQAIGPCLARASSHQVIAQATTDETIAIAAKAAACWKNGIEQEMKNGRACGQHPFLLVGSSNNSRHCRSSKKSRRCHLIYGGDLDLVQHSALTLGVHTERPQSVHTEHQIRPTLPPPAFLNPSASTPPHALVIGVILVVAHQPQQTRHERPLHLRVVKAAPGWVKVGQRRHECRQPAVAQRVHGSSCCVRQQRQLQRRHTRALCAAAQQRTLLPAAAATAAAACAACVGVHVLERECECGLRPRG